MNRARRHQNGYAFRKGNAWYLRYRETEVQAGGKTKLVQKCRKLVDFGGRYRSKKSVQVHADEFLAPMNNGSITLHSTMALAQFVESRYLPFIKMNKRPSTYRGYTNMWNRYLRSRGDVALRDFRTVDGEHTLEEIVQEHDLTCTTMAHIKAFLSGVFRYAKRQGVLNTENPTGQIQHFPGKVFFMKGADVRAHQHQPSNVGCHMTVRFADIKAGRIGAIQIDLISSSLCSDVSARNCRPEIVLLQKLSEWGEKT